jgi:DNA-binding MarR family transcriptional regulator
MNTDPDLMACADCLCLASRKAARAITSAFDRRLRGSGVRATQFTILASLMLMGPQPIGDLARALGLERTTLSRNLDLLESKGWVESRAGDDDARARITSVTEQGRAIVRDNFSAWRTAQASVLATVGEAGAQALRKLASAPIR